jgi:branched-chain amino acid transport system substrate-binding protein
LPKYFEEAEKTEPKTKAFVAAYKTFYKRDFPYDQAPLCSSSCYDHVFMLVEAMKKAGTVDDVGKVKTALMSLTYNGIWNIRYDKTGEAVFDFDVLHMKKGGKISSTHIEPK